MCGSLWSTCCKPGTSCAKNAREFLRSWSKNFIAKLRAGQAILWGAHCGKIRLNFGGSTEQTLSTDGTTTRRLSVVSHRESGCKGRERSNNINRKRGESGYSTKLELSVLRYEQTD